MQKKTITDLDRVTPEGFSRQAKTPLTVVLDNVRSLNNIGSVFRTCDAFAIEKLWLCGISSTPDQNRAEIHKTALGAELTVAWQHADDTLSVLDTLRREGYTLLCLEQVKGSIELQDFTPRPGARYALVLGHEVNGVSQQAVDRCDICLEIPQRGTKHSLNVAISGGIAIWHIFSRICRAE